MKRYKFLITLLITAQILGLSALRTIALQQRSTTAKQTKTGFIDNEVIVKYRKNVPLSSQRSIERSLNAQRLNKLELIDAVHLKVGKGLALNTVKALNETGKISYAEPNFKRKLTLTPNDSKFGQQWSLYNTGQTIRGKSGVVDADIDATEAWSRSKGSNNVVVAVVDTGIQWSHPDLQDNMWINHGEIPGNGFDDDKNGFIDDVSGWDFYYDDNSVYDNINDFHGTHVAGIIGAKSNNTIGIAGINWDIRIMAVKFIGDFGYGSVADEIKALGYASKNGAQIINASFGSVEYSLAEYNAIKALNQKNILFVAAAGNWGDNNDAFPMYPASYPLPNIISTGMSDNTDRKQFYSNSGVNSVHLIAPGANILSTYPVSTYAFLTGTSMAAPHVTGSAALLAVKFSQRGIRLKNKLLKSVDKKSAFQRIFMTGGRLNIWDALRNIEPTLTAPTNGATLTRGATYKFRWNKNGGSGIVYKIVLSKKTGAKQIEDFEKKRPSGTKFLGAAPWDRTTNVKYRGRYSFVSGKISHSQSSSFYFTRYIGAASYISFRYKVSSERVAAYSSGDSLNFYIDGNHQGFRLSGSTGWRTYRKYISKGWHSFKWVYAKDYSISRNQDRAWVDNIRFTVKPRKLQSFAIGLSAMDATSVSLRIPASIPAGNYTVSIYGIYGSKRTASSSKNISVR